MKVSSVSVDRKVVCEISLTIEHDEDLMCLYRLLNDGDDSLPPVLEDLRSEIEEPTGLSLCLYDPSTGMIHTTLKLRSALEPKHVGPDEYVCAYSRKTVAQLVEEGRVNKEVVMVTFDEAMKASYQFARKIYCTGPQEIQAVEWLDLLEVLYPARWEHEDDWEVFMMPECITHSIYVFGVRIRGHHFKVYEDRLTDSAELVRQCRELI